MKSRFKFVLILAISLCLSGVAPAGQEDPDQILQRALALHQAGRYEGAIDEYERLLEFGSIPPDLYTNLGAAYAALGDVQKAIENYLKALDLGGNSPALRMNLGLAYYKTMDLTSAIEQFEVLLQSDPGNLQAALLVGDCYFRMGEYDAVIAALDPFSRLAATNAGIAYLLGTSLIRLDRIQQGQEYVEVILSQGDSAEAHLLLADGYRSTHDIAKALEEVKQAIALNGELPGSHALLGELLFSVSGIDQLKRNPALLGEVRIPEDLESPVKAFRQELAINPTHFEAHLYLGFLLKELGQYEEAIEHLKKAAELRPMALQVNYHLGQTYLLDGKLERARDTLESLVKRLPNLREAHSLLAAIYHRLRNKEEARQHRQAVVELTRNSGRSK